MAVSAAGLLAGVIGAFALTRFMRSLLFQVEPSDPVTFVSIPVVLGLAGARGDVRAGPQGCANRPPSDKLETN